MLRFNNKRLKKLRKKFHEHVLKNVKRFLSNQIINC